MSTSQEQVLQTLQELGLTRLDSQIYLYLSKKGSQKGAEISKGLKVQKQPLYRCLKHLQSKGIITVTLEHPARFCAVSFEQVVDIFVKVKMAEAQRLQEAKNELITKWKAISIGESTDTSAKFNLVSGRGNIYSKIMQMMKKTKTNLSVISTIKGIARGDHYGLFEGVNENSNKITYRVLTQVTKHEINAAQKILKEFKKSKGLIEARTPELGLNLFPEMVVRDDEETVFFISPLNSPSSSEQDEVCLWTDCKSLVQAMTAIFEDLWHNSTDLEHKIVELETCKSPVKTCVFDQEKAIKEYTESVRSALKEVTVLTSSYGLVNMSRQNALLSEWAKRKVSVRIMAPITRNNLSAAHQLSQFCQVKHVPVGCSGITVVDNINMFEFNNSTSIEVDSTKLQNFDSIFFSNDQEYVQKTNKMLDDMWRNAQEPLSINMEISRKELDKSEILSEDHPYKKLIGTKIADARFLTEKEVLEKIIHGKKLNVNNPQKDVHRVFSTGGMVTIHPPSHLKLPDLMIEISQIENQSSLGASNVLTVYQWLSTEKVTGYAAVAYVYTAPLPHAAAKQLFKDTLAGDNILLVNEDELQIRTHGNTMFAGWTIPIPLLPRSCVLPPACLTLEGYGKIHSVGYSLIAGTGVKCDVEQNYFDAFVTFIHPHSKYSGAGTDGFLARDYIFEIKPP